MKNKIEFKVCGQGNNPEAYKECEEFIEKWKKILRIQDWETNLSFVSGEEIYEQMGSFDYVASCDRDLVNKTACISVNVEHSKINECIEKTLLHELLHIVTYEWQNVVENSIEDEKLQEYSRVKMEQTVESLAKSFAYFAEVKT